MQKQEVAASQNYECGHCGKRMRVWDVDHIEPHALRERDDRKNLVALCVKCHRVKTRETQLFADCLFEERLPPLRDRDGTLLFSKYFCDSHVEGL